MKQREYYVYIVTNPNRTTLYVGVTNDIARRLVEHYANRGRNKTFAGRYYCYSLVYIEGFQYINDAIQREKEIKLLGRNSKNLLISSFNPIWKFLNAEWCEEWPPSIIWGNYYRSLRGSGP